MQVLSDGRIRRTAPEWKEILDRFGKNGLPMAAFCEKEEISRSAFASWKKKLEGRRAIAQKKTPSFVELSDVMTKKSMSPEVVSAGTSFELALPGGVTLRWNGGSKSSWPIPMYRWIRTIWNAHYVSFPWAGRIDSFVGRRSARSKVGQIQSLIATCVLHDVDPYTYLVDVLQRIDTHPQTQVSELTPRIWKEKFAEAPLKSMLGRAAE